MKKNFISPKIKVCGMDLCECLLQSSASLGLSNTNVVNINYTTVEAASGGNNDARRGGIWSSVW